jgi:hypothetical protein
MTNYILISFIQVLFLSGCESNFSKGKALLDEGRATEALQSFQKVTQDEKDFTEAQQYCISIRDSLSGRIADSMYLASDYAGAVDEYGRIKLKSSRTSRRILICKKAIEYQGIKDMVGKYKWLQQLCSECNQKRFHSLKIPPLIRFRPMYWMADNNHFGALDYAIVTGRQKSLEGEYTCVWTSDVPLENYQWHGDSMTFDVRMFRSLWTLRTCAEVPKRRDQIFLLQYNGGIPNTDEYQHHMIIPRLDIVAVLGYNFVYGIPGVSQPTVAEEVLTVPRLSETIETLLECGGDQPK